MIIYKKHNFQDRVQEKRLCYKESTHSRQTSKIQHMIFSGVISILNNRCKADVENRLGPRQDILSKYFLNHYVKHIHFNTVIN